MSTPAASRQPRPVTDPAAGLIIAATDQLVPFFLNYTPDRSEAQKMAVSAIAAYEPESRADFVSTARTIAFSMAALKLLRKADSDDMPMAEKLRAYGHANTLNRSADQSERTMMRRRLYQKANPPAELPDWMHAKPRSEAPLEDYAVCSAIEEAWQAARATPAPKPAEPRKPAESKPPAPASANARPVQHPIPTAAPTPDAAIRYNAPNYAAAAPQTTFKSALSQNAAMPQLPRDGTTQRAA